MPADGRWGLTLSQLT